MDTGEGTLRGPSHLSVGAAISFPLILSLLRATVHASCDTRGVRLPDPPPQNASNETRGLRCTGVTMYTSEGVHERGVTMYTSEELR